MCTGLVRYDEARAARLCRGYRQHSVSGGSSLDRGVDRLVTRIASLDALFLSISIRLEQHHRARTQRTSVQTVPRPAGKSLRTVTSDVCASGTPWHLTSAQISQRTETRIIPCTHGTARSPERPWSRWWWRSSLEDITSAALGCRRRVFARRSPAERHEGSGGYAALPRALPRPCSIREFAHCSMRPPPHYHTQFLCRLPELRTH